MSLPPIKSADLPVLLENENININKKLGLVKHMKKKAANDAQLLMYSS
jgi:hypothetical protein